MKTINKPGRFFWSDPVFCRILFPGFSCPNIPPWVGHHFLLYLVCLRHAPPGPILRQAGGSGRWIRRIGEQIFGQLHIHKLNQRGAIARFFDCTHFFKGPIMRQRSIQHLKCLTRTPSGKQPGRIHPGFLLEPPASVRPDGEKNVFYFLNQAASLCLLEMYFTGVHLS